MSNTWLEKLNPEFIAKAMNFALGNTPPNDLAYLLATGKSELNLRDQLAIHLNKTLEFGEDEFVGREWRKHDLTINRGKSPLALIEGKSYIHYDAANKMHLENGKNTIKHDLERDLEKCHHSNKKSKLETKIFFTAILFTVEALNPEDYRHGDLTYGTYHRQGIRRFGTLPALRQEGNENLSGLLSRYGTTHHVELSPGHYRNLAVVADFHVLQVN